MSTASLGKGTRKTYSFEEREILVNLIYKYLNGGDEEKSCEAASTTTTMTAGGTGGKRKSVWSQLTEEYNALVGPENTRSSIQLRRCWENMKANKKNRDDKSGKIVEKGMTENLQPPTSSIGLPPNVVFQPKDSEPFTFEGVMPAVVHDADVKKEEEGSGLGDEEQGNDGGDSVSMDELGFEADEVPAAKRPKRAKPPSPSPSSPPRRTAKQQRTPKSARLQKNGELYVFAISEAQLKLDTAAILKEEAKLKLEEAEYRKEEARMRMICATYKLQKLREECEDAAEEIAAEK